VYLRKLVFIREFQIRSGKEDKLGTTDATDFVFITNNEERLRITADGEIKLRWKIHHRWKFRSTGNSTRINNDLYVGRNVVLNFDEGRSRRKLIGKFTGIDDGTFEDDLNS
jgi:hypothetical protein